MVDFDKEGKYVTSKFPKHFLCPYCSTDFDEKKLFIEHLLEQHPRESKHLDRGVLDKLEKYKQGETDILNI